MFTTRLPVPAIERLRLEAEYYDPAKLAGLGWLQRWKSRCEPLEDLCSLITDGTHVTPSYQETGVRFLSSTNINNSWIDYNNTKFISEIAHRQFYSTNCSPQPGDILLAKNGKIGTAAMYRGHHPACSLFVSVALLRYSGDIDPDFVISFLNSLCGWNQFARSAKTGVITNLHLEEIREVMVPRPNVAVQTYIGDKLRLAEKLRARSAYLLGASTRLVDLLIERTIVEDTIKSLGINAAGRVAPQQESEVRISRHTRTRCSELTSRIDAWYYQPHLVAAFEKIKASGNCQVLADVIDSDRDVSGGATPLGAEYLTDGVVRFYRTSEVGGLAVSKKDAVFISDEQDRSMARSRLAEGDVLLTITGADFGHAGAITKEHLPGNISQHSVRFRPTIDASYLVAYLESSYGQRMIWRQAYGATRPAIDYPGVKSLLIRIPDASVQKIIGDAVRIGVIARDCAMALVAGSQSLVEALIEGKVREAELQAAHTDRDADQEILRRLSVGGLDVEGASPLFDDFDSLNLAIEEAMQAERAEGGAT